MTEPGLTIFERREFRGLYSLRKSTEIPANFASHVLNCDLSSSSQISPMKGYSLYGRQANTGHKITNTYRYERGLGFETLLQVRDNGTNAILEYLNPGDDRNSANGEWTPIVTNFTTGKIIMFAPYNDTGTDNLLGSNGSDNLWRWSGAVCLADGAITASAGTISVKKITGDPKTNATDGFASSGSFVYKDTAGAITTVTYTGKTASTFTGCSGATASAGNTGIAEAVDTSTYSSLSKFTFLLTAQGRLWGTGTPTQPTVMLASAVGDFTNFTASTNPGDPLAEDFPEGGANKVLAGIDNWILVFKEKQLVGYSLQFPSSTSRVAVRKHVADIGIANVKAIDRVGNDYVFVSPEGQIRMVSRIESENLFNTQDIGLLIRPTIKNFDFISDGTVKYWPKERILMIAGRSDSDQSVNDRVVTIQISENAEGQTIYNHGILDWFVGGMAVYNEDLHFGGSSDSRNYLAFDGYSKNGGGYDFEYTTKAEHFGKEFEQKEICYLAVKGRIGAGTELLVDVYFDEEAKTALYEYNLLQSDSDYVVEGVSNPLGSSALGAEPLGGNIEDIDELDPFFVVYEIPLKANPYTVQANFRTSGAGQRVVVDSYAWYVAPTSNVISKLKGAKA